MGRRRVLAGPAVVAWRAGREDVRRVLVAENVPAALGPHRDGWTIARVFVHGEEVVEPRGRVVVDLVDDLARTLGGPGATCQFNNQGGLLLIGCSGSAPPVHAHLLPADAAEPADRRQWAELLGALGAADRLGPVLEAATAVADDGRRRWLASAMGDTRRQAVAAAAGLPAQFLDPDLGGDPAPLREVAVCHSRDAVTVPFASSLLRVPVRTVEVDQTLVIVPEPVDGTVMGPVVEVLGNRRPALVLWRHGDARGYLLFRKGAIEDAHTWTEDWEVVGLAPDIDAGLGEQLRTDLTPSHGNADLLVARFAGAGAGKGTLPDPDPVQLRSVLRRPSRPETLAAFCDMLRLPPLACEVVEHGAQAMDAVETTLVTPTSIASSVVDASRKPRPNDPWFIRLAHARPWWFRILDVMGITVAIVLAVRLWPGGWLSGVGVSVLLLAAVLCTADLALSLRMSALRNRAARQLQQPQRQQQPKPMPGPGLRDEQPTASEERHVGP